MMFHLRIQDSVSCVETLTSSFVKCIDWFNVIGGSFYATNIFAVNNALLHHFNNRPVMLFITAYFVAFV